MTDDSRFWSGKNVLVTGHTGFKGAWLVSWLLDLGVNVTGLSDGITTDPSMYSLCGFSDTDVRDVRGDVRNGDRVRRVVEEAKPDIIFHLAAQSLVRESYADPVGTYATNVMGTVNVLEAVRSTKVPVTIVVTSDKCYENREWLWGYREVDRLGGHDPYSSSKACAELVTEAYRSSFLGAADDVRLASARAGNVIGGGDWSADRLVPDLMRGALAGSAVQIRHPTSIRPWQHVLDCLSGYLLLAQRLWADPSLQGGWNFGPDAADQRSVREVVDLLAELWPGGLEIVVNEGDEQLHEAGVLTLDCTAARQRLDWRPFWTVEQSLHSLVEWYLAYKDGADMSEITLRQLRRRTSEA